MVPDPPTTAASTFTYAYECFICFEPMHSTQDLIVNPTGIVTHKACLDDQE